MTPQEHYDEAIQYLNNASKTDFSLENLEVVRTALMFAQVHATLSLFRPVVEARPPTTSNIRYSNESFYDK